MQFSPLHVLLRPQEKLRCKEACVSDISPRGVMSFANRIFIAVLKQTSFITLKGFLSSVSGYC